MKHLTFSIALAALAGCNLATPTDGGGGGGAGLSERLVLGSTMSFEQCQARGGLIIRDAGSSMVACDPHVQGPRVPDDEFAHPAQPSNTQE